MSSTEHRTLSNGSLGRILLSVIRYGVALTGFSLLALAMGVTPASGQDIAFSTSAFSSGDSRKDFCERPEDRYELHRDVRRPLNRQTLPQRLVVGRGSTIFQDSVLSPAALSPAASSPNGGSDERRTSGASRRQRPPERPDRSVLQRRRRRERPPERRSGEATQGQRSAGQGWLRRFTRPGAER